MSSNTKILFITAILLFGFKSFSQSTSRDTLILGYNLTPPFIMEDNGILHGPCVKLWEQVASEHDIPYKWVEFTLDSLLAGLASGEIDLSGSPLTITSDRMEQMDFSPPYYIAMASLLSHDISSTKKIFKFVRSFFSANFLRALLALVIVILIFGLLEWLFERKNNKEEFSKGIKGLWQGFWWSAVTMTTVGYGDKSPKSVGGRVVALIWMFTAIIIISGFTAGIASALTVDRLGSSDGTIQDFKDDRLGTIEGSATERWLVGNFFTNRESFTELSELTEALRDEKIDAIAYDRPILMNILKQDTLSEFRLVNVKYNPQYYAMGINRALPESFKKDISVSIVEYTESMDWKVLLSEFDLTE